MTSGFKAQRMRGALSAIVLLAAAGSAWPGAAAQAAVAATGTATTATVPAGASAAACGPWTAQTRFGTHVYRLSGVAALSRRDVWVAGQSGSGAPLALRWNGHRWRKAPGPATPPGSLVALSFASARNGWAVGIDGSVVAQTVIEHWDGTGFRLVASPNPGGTSVQNLLAGVAAPSARNAWAVGSYEFGSTNSLVLTLILHWDGDAWTQVPSPNPGTGPPRSAIFSLLQGVAAVSATDAWAVGAFRRPPPSLSNTLIVHWDGHAWTQVPSLNPTGRSELTAVSAVSARDVWAVGQYFNGFGDQTLIEHWNGRVWKRVPSPDPAGSRHGNNLTSVTAVSARDAWAAGWTHRHGASRVLLLHWNGSSWRTVPTPAVPGGFDPELSAISASSASNVWAVGDGRRTVSRQAFALHC